jgi:hypothetical protein
LLLAALLLGCGGAAPGAPGSSGAENTGVMLDATLIPTYNNANVYSVDTFQQICDAGPPPTYEIFTDHGAAVTVNARLLNPNTTFTPGTLYIERYTVEFRRSNDSIGSPPIETDTRYISVIITPPSGTDTSTVTFTAIFVDLKRKDKYRTDMLSGIYTSGLAYINNYTAVYTFYGKNQYGTSFSFQTQTNFQIGSFNNC